MKDGWNQATLGDVLALIRNGTNCEQAKSGEGYKISRIETIAASSINPERVGYAKLTEDQKRNFKLRKNDILFSHINSAAHIGKTAIVDDDYDIYHGINLLLLRPLESVDPLYLQHYLNFLFRNGYWRTICKQSVNQASVNQADIKKVAIVHPKSLAEQKRIVAILDNVLGDSETVTANLEENLTKTTELFETVLDFNSATEASLEDLVSVKTGKLDVNAATKNGIYPFFTCSRNTYRIDKPDCP